MESFSLGHFALIAAWMLATYSMIAGVFGARAKSDSLCLSSLNAFYMSVLCSLVSLGALGIAFLNHDYQNAYVWQHSNNTMHPLYLISAIWGGMDGSMLLWAVLGAAFGGLALRNIRKEAPALIPWATVIFAGTMFFFLGVVTFLTNPFRFIPTSTIPLDGKGLNPLLQNPSMLIHPVTLYLGFTGLAVPFAFCLSSLLSGQLSGRWIELTRRWTLVAWGFLTAGIILGGNWAYIELGWGGFWAWDPVENASFFPWLTATAFIHSVMVEQHRGMFRTWNALLCCTTYILTVFGTFLTRSGVVQSVHAFAESDVGWVFLVYILALSVVSLACIFYRRNDLSSSRKLESFFSRETAFLINNLALVSICFATIWGVMFPVMTDALMKTRPFWVEFLPAMLPFIPDAKAVVGAPFFNSVNGPLFLALLLFMGIGPLIAWRNTSKKVLLKTFRFPVLLGMVTTIACLFYSYEQLIAAITFGLCAFVAATIMQEFHRGAAVRKELTEESVAGRYVNLIRRKPRRYGGHIVHLGVTVMAFAITASMIYKVERDFSLASGQRYEIGSYSLELTRLWEAREKNYLALMADVTVFDRSSGEKLGILHPEQRMYANEQSTTEVDIRMTLAEDLYIALGGLDTIDRGSVDLATVKASFKVFINPFQVWLWIGSLIVMFGTVVVYVPRFLFGEERARKASRIGVAKGEAV